MLPESRRAKLAAKAVRTPHRWSAQVVPSGDALDLEQGIFAQDDPLWISACAGMTRPI